MTKEQEHELIRKSLRLLATLLDDKTLCQADLDAAKDLVGLIGTIQKEEGTK